MHDMEGLRLGMFLAGLVMAAAPISLAIGVAIYVWRRHRQDLADGRVEDRAGAADGGGGPEHELRAGGLP